MPRALRYPLLLAAVSAVVFGFNLGGARLWDIDEAIFSQAAREMLARGDAIVPYFNGQVFTHKPVLMYWTMMAAYETFGISEFAARFPSALFGVGSVLLTFWLGRLIFSPRVGLMAGLVLATNLSFVIIARAATPDSLLVFFSTLAVLFFVSGTAKARAQSGTANDRNAPWAGQTSFQPGWWCWARVYAAMACAVLTKGPIGVLLPTSVIGLFLLIVRASAVEQADDASWRGRSVRLLRQTMRVLSIKHICLTIWSMRPLSALLVVLTVAGPWYAWVGTRTDGVWLAGFFGVHNFGRFLNAMDNHRGPLLYYVAAIAIGFSPWSPFLAPALLNMKRQTAAAEPWRPGLILLACWGAVWIGFFSLAGTKLPSYVAPAYPAIALATACFLDRLLREPQGVSRVWARLGFGTIAVIGLALAIALPIVARKYLEPTDWLAATGVILLVAGVAAWILHERKGARPALISLATMAALWAVVLFGVAGPRIDRFQECPEFASVIRELTPPGEEPQIATLFYFRPSLVYYSQRPVAELQSAAAACEFFKQHPRHAYLLMVGEQFEQYRGEFPAELQVLDKRRRFLKPGSVVLLGRETPLSVARKSAAASR